MIKKKHTLDLMYVSIILTVLNLKKLLSLQKILLGAKINLANISYCSIYGLICSLFTILKRIVPTFYRA